MIIERQSVVDAPAEQVWARVVTPEGINDEFHPWMTMSKPRGSDLATIDDVAVGTPIGRCWLRLFGVVPFDYDQLCITELQPGRRFCEESTMLSMRRWRHERSVTPASPATAVVHDRVTFELRAPLRSLTPVVGRVLGALFEYRHRRLQRHFATGP